MRIDSGGVVRPGADNTQSLGAASYRWSVVYAGTGTINTSDEREKQQIANLDDAERRVSPLRSQGTCQRNTSTTTQ
jgi:hypothetical protein